MTGSYGSPEAVLFMIGNQPYSFTTDGDWRFLT